MDEVQALAGRYSISKEEDLLELLMFINSWLIDHIDRADKQYVDELHAAGIR